MKMTRTSCESLLAEIQEAEVVRLCRDLVRLNTTNPPGDERKCAEFVAAYLDDVGLAVELVPHTPTRASVLARLQGSGEVPALLYNGHLDVVPVGSAEWLHDPFGGEVVDGKLWGRGAADMKGGNAAMLTAAKVLAESDLPLRGDFILAFTAGEEGEQLGATELVSRPDLTPLQAIVIAEPSYNEVYIAEKGVFWLEVTTHGETAHGSAPHLGQNAIMMMVTLLSELDKLTLSHEEHPLLGGFTRSINTIAGGVGTNVVPDKCVATIDQRTVPDQDHHTILRQIEELIVCLSKRTPNFHASVSVINDLEPVATSLADPVVKRFTNVVAKITGKHPTPKGASYYTDGAVFAPELEVPLIICGPGDSKLAHQPNEYVEIQKMIEASKIVTLAAVELLT